MEKLIIESTDSSPRIYFDPDKSIFVIAGESRPENSEKFYGPIIDWFKKYYLELKASNSTKPLHFEMHMDYYNSATARSLVELFGILDMYVAINIPVNINWYYMENDIDLKNQGEELAKIASGLKFVMICLEHVV